MMNDIPLRLKKIISDLGHTPASFADEIGVQRSSISHALSGRNKPGLDFLQKALSRFPEIDIHWFLTGQIIDKQSFMIESSDREETIKRIKDEKTVVKVLTFYNDQTFDEYRPSNSE